MSDFHTVNVTKGHGGWGDGLTLTPTPEKKIVLSVTGGGIHPIARHIAELSGAQAVDGFKNHVEDEKVLAAVINCGGTARIGVYPKKRIPTVDIYPGSPSGPLAKYITADIFVSDVGASQITLAEGEDVVPAAATVAPGTAGAPASTDTDADADTDTDTEVEEETTYDETVDAKGFTGLVVKFGGAIGYIINTLLAAGRQSIDIMLKTVIPFMAYVGLLIGFVNYTGLSDLIAQGVSPLASNPLGLLLLSVIVALPFLSPILGPGGAIAQVVGVLMGTQIGAGALPVQYALPTLFAIDGQVGADFIPVGLSLGEAKPETVSVGVPAVLFTRLVTSPIAVLIAYAASFLLV
ncbi:PTS glucitol/sorbitol transporter subunit IIB [Brachybacterium sp. FME24]|uniref:PTS glucitol/sorbitol transporter subunit IIB n=1 Tax=Brachybacterium sp. FME24 TaxID=2742605 RepID=UPI001866D543|nr:PTS glucitol/sorbitol transporter subunit IIB [Brachybacterium sp. FME24]